jgi:hypothetical protein
VEAVVVAAWKRRDTGVATGAILLAVFGAVAALVLPTRSNRDAGATLQTRSAEVSPTQVHGHLVFGMTRHQVLRRTGHPIKTQGNCWLFVPTKTGIVGSISVQPSWSRLPFNPKTQGGLKLCFVSGRYSYGLQHMFDPQKHRWIWFPWPLTLMHGSSPDYSDNL